MNNNIFISISTQAISPVTLCLESFVSRMYIYHNICTSACNHHIASLRSHNYLFFRSLFVAYLHSFDFLAAFFRGENTHFHWSMYIAVYT
ncbi:hypothetical protein CY34DRAFT_133043 [Suillus luteus UH-Slu-Lm8-n1]|uniref:Uncharacterized protein n=1 Tax=Suillus luteus UH-Slu-Lm8-n1 TaxID=930992 RepID=A0A0C9ZY77_9AGAM|nr:hypothetical protein CY34DRAFT_133043 [Suillus luteus UH-Slu-Lm8-n1]